MKRAVVSVAVALTTWCVTASPHEGRSPATSTSTTTTTAGAVVAEQPTNGRPPNLPLLYTSTATLALAYVPSVAVGLSSPIQSDVWLLAPVFGPWVAFGEGVATRNWVGDIALVVDGVVQGVAAIGIAASMVL